MSAENVLALDRYQFTAQKRTCQSEPRHGTLLPHIAGGAFTCGRKGCDYTEPVSAELLAEALALR